MFGFPDSSRFRSVGKWPSVVYALLMIGVWVCLVRARFVQAEIASPAEAQIGKVLAEQSLAWNRGDIDGFMSGYARLPTLRFASGGSVTYGWQETLDRYKQHYPDRAAMGALTFSDLDVTILSPEAALVFGRWRLKSDKGEPNGLFTLLFRQIDHQWRIVADHTSAAAVPGS